MSPQPHTPHEEGIMIQPSLCNFIDAMSDCEFSQLYDYVIAAGAIRGISSFPTTNDPVYVNDVIDMHGANFASPSPTLRPSRRSSFQSSSIYCKDFANPEPVTSAYPTFEIQDPTARQENGNTTRGVAKAVVKETHTSTPPSLLEVPQGHNIDKARTGLNPTKPSNQLHTQPRSPFFCTYCHELNIQKTFTTKQDWKRHEVKFHETGMTWHCSDNNCLEVFAREKDWKSHCTSVHGNKQYPRPSRYDTPTKVVYACGFENCKKLAPSWRERCDHVARCMRAGNGDWTYTWRILNLLQQPEVYPTWKIIKSHWCKRIGLDTSNLNWDPKTSRIMVQQLECHTFDANLESFLERLLKLGHPYYRVSQNFRERHSELKPLPHLPTEPSSNFEATQQSNMTSYADQRHPGFDNAGNSIGEHTMEEQKRQSVTMVDAPALSTGNTEFPFLGFENHGLTFNDMLHTIPYSTNITPPLSVTTSQPFENPGAETTRPSQRLNLVRRSKEWLTQKKSQQFQTRIITDHPDLTLDYSVPAALPRDHSNASNTFAVGTTYNYQS